MTRRALHTAVAAALLVTAGCAGRAETTPSPGQERAGITTGPRAGPELASHPEGILSPDSIRALQRSLRAKGIGAPLTGEYDRATEDAVRTFQRRSELAETGMPSMTTLRALGLDPVDIYRQVEPARGQPRPWWLQTTEEAAPGRAAGPR